MNAATQRAAAQAATQVCRGPQHAAVVAELMFGRAIAGRRGVSEAAWRRFVAREITPRFPDGLTIVNATGQWREPASGRIVREASKLVTIVLPGQPDDQMRLDAIAAAYKHLFRQKSVGIVEQSACVSF